MPSGGHLGPSLKICMANVYWIYWKDKLVIIHRKEMWILRWSGRFGLDRKNKMAATYRAKIKWNTVSQIFLLQHPMRSNEPHRAWKLSWNCSETRQEFAVYCAMCIHRFLRSNLQWHVRSSFSNHIQHCTAPPRVHCGHRCWRYKEFVTKCMNIYIMLSLYT